MSMRVSVGDEMSGKKCLFFTRTLRVGIILLPFLIIDSAMASDDNVIDDVIDVYQKTRMMDAEGRPVTWDTTPNVGSVNIGKSSNKTMIDGIFSELTRLGIVRHSSEDLFDMVFYFVSSFSSAENKDVERIYLDKTRDGGAVYKKLISSLPGNNDGCYGTLFFSYRISDRKIKSITGAYSVISDDLDDHHKEICINKQIMMFYGYSGHYSGDRKTIMKMGDSEQKLTDIDHILLKIANLDDLRAATNYNESINVIKRHGDDIMKSLNYEKN